MSMQPSHVAAGGHSEENAPNEGKDNEAGHAWHSDQKSFTPTG